jgi:hypothetical protein
MFKKYKDKQSMKIYKFINKGILNFYYFIIKDILIRFNNITLQTAQSEPFIINLNVFHYITINKLFKFIEFLLKSSKIRIDNYIDIKNCSGDVLYGFVLFNNFKDIIDSFNEKYQKKVMIYARINDFDIPNKIMDRKIMFEQDRQNTQQLNVKLDQCIDLDLNREIRVKFNDIFGSEFTDNLTISKYLTVASQITKKKGVVFMTYGYSGTGKTVTLFGNQDKTGLLQATLQNVRGIEKIYFRVFEIYGKGVNYTDYWGSGGNIYERIYSYGLELNKNKIKIKNIKETEKIKEYIDGSDDLIEINDPEEVFKTFNELVDELDKKRKQSKRIIKTPNNPESSRSIIIYEFLNKIGNDLVPFTLIDLPGREEILDSYQNPYLITSTTNILNQIQKCLLSSVLI